MKSSILICFLLLIFSIYTTKAQQDSLSPLQPLKEVIVSSSRIEIPFSETSRTIQIITSEELSSSGALTALAALQNIAGIDIRQRGIIGIQADLYIRGGGFDQTLLLIDGVKLDDPQTGHHTLNFIPPVDVIERIEIVKGSSSRVFGQNAFTGAINIVTKKSFSKGGSINLKAGSYGQVHGEINYINTTKKGNFLAYFTRNISDGYRYNTDFENNTIFLKAGLFENKIVPVQFIASFSGRKFGANGFYASPDANNQYEETEASIVAFQTKINKGNWVYKPKIYWRRGQDHYLFIRSNPEAYENWHITHKLGASLDVSLSSKLGTTGMGIDLSRVSIASNNLGGRSRQLAAFFFEHRFSFWNKKLDITPGVALNLYSDFGAFSYPGVDLGYTLNKEFRVYGNFGYTYRIPTYTDLYYKDKTTRGNPNLKPEEALSKELGLRFNSTQFIFYIAYFERKANNLIDYTKSNAESLWEATNILALNVKGFEAEINYPFIIGNKEQQLKFSYTFIKDDLKAVDVNFSKYSINSLKYHFASTFVSNISSNIQCFVALKYADRPSIGRYTLLDLNLQWDWKSFQFNASANNLLDTQYSETNLVPMPGRNTLLSVQYNF
jgi:iron complex outermembrane receptor protein